MKDRQKLISTYKGYKIFQENLKGEDGLVAYDPVENIVAWRFGIDNDALNQVIRDIENFNKTVDSKVTNVMKIGDTVKFKKPANADEEKARFILAEEPNIMGKVKIRLIPDKNFGHAFSEYVHESEIERV
jgi:hypothetical protein